MVIYIQLKGGVMLKRLIGSILALGITFSLFSPTASATIKEEVSTDNEVYLGTYVEYEDENGDLVTEPYSLELIKELEMKDSEQDVVSPRCIACVGDFTYKTYEIYDQGITKSWSWLSNPYFIISIARGATVTNSMTVKTSITASYSGSIPYKAGVRSKLGINSSNSKSFTVKVSLSGPGKGYSSRDFYYQKGRHTHKIKTVVKTRKKNGKVINTKTHYGNVGVPAIKNYSKDRK